MMKRNPSVRWKEKILMAMTWTYIEHKCDIEYMKDEGGWRLDETHYYICDGCVLVPEGEDIEDYAQDDGTYANK